MKALILDGSAALGFLMPDDRSPTALAALDALDDGVPAFVPAHWRLEVANGLLTAERRKRITQADASEALQALFSLPVEIDEETARHVSGETVALARQYRLTVYDAAYLELAMRRGATLATGDAAMAKAARAAGVRVL